MITHITCPGCKLESQMDMMAEFRYTNIAFMNAITAVSVQCTACKSIFMVSLPHESIMTKEEAGKKGK